MPENSLRKDDPKFELELDPDEAQFFQSQTGITNLEELRSHILSVQEEALKVFFPVLSFSLGIH